MFLYEKLKRDEFLGRYHHARSNFETIMFVI